MGTGAVAGAATGARAGAAADVGAAAVGAGALGGPAAAAAGIPGALVASLVIAPACGATGAATGAGTVVLDPASVLWAAVDAAGTPPAAVGVALWAPSAALLVAAVGACISPLARVEAPVGGDAAGAAAAGGCGVAAAGSMPTAIKQGRRSFQSVPPLQHTGKQNVTLQALSTRTWQAEPNQGPNTAAQRSFAPTQRGGRFEFTFIRSSGFECTLRFDRIALASHSTLRALFKLLVR